MYSPKIKPELIPKLYLLAKEVKRPMTVLVSDIIEDYLSKDDRYSDSDDFDYHDYDD